MCLLRDILAGASEDERGELVTDLARDWRWAFGLGPDGLIKIPVSFWVTQVSLRSFDSGTYMHCCPDGTYAALPIAILCAGAPEATDDTTPEYIPPFVALMLDAVREFAITAANPSPDHELLVEYFKGKIVEGQTISESLAKRMATLCRAPEAMRGGRQ
jgi:hypothetical protein